MVQDDVNTLKTGTDTDGKNQWEKYRINPTENDKPEAGDNWKYKW